MSFEAGPLVTSLKWRLSSKLAPVCDGAVMVRGEDGLENLGESGARMEPVVELIGDRGFLRSLLVCHSCRSGLLMCW